MHATVCRVCGAACGNLPDGEDHLTTCDGCKGAWTREEKEELFTNVFGRPPGIPKE